MSGFHPGPGLAPSPEERIYTVSEISALIRQSLETTFPWVAVEGEVTGLITHDSGHTYFALTDRDQRGSVVKLECVIYRFTSAARSIIFKNGDRVIARGRISSWPGSSKVQLVVASITLSGLGDLLRRLEETKRRLMAEGLFAQERKRPLPFLPRKIGIATSLQGAAVRDMVRIILDRFPATIVIAPCLVQGDEAPSQIAASIEALNKVPEVDVIIVGRGGGSFEDLFAFNEEVVVRAIAASRVPVISAVGHEVDHVLSDDAADLRAPTPTKAGEMVVPRLTDLKDTLEALETRLWQALARQLDLLVRLLDDCEARLRRISPLEPFERRLENIETRLRARHPARILQLEARILSALGRRFLVVGKRLLEPYENSLKNMAFRLSPLNPFEPLQRGYALARSKGGEIIRSYDQAPPGSEVIIWLSKGTLDCVVTSCEEDWKKP